MYWRPTGFDSYFSQTTQQGGPNNDENVYETFYVNGNPYRTFIGPDGQETTKMGEHMKKLRELQGKIDQLDLRQRGLEGLPEYQRKEEERMIKEMRKKLENDRKKLDENLEAIQSVVKVKLNDMNEEQRAEYERRQETRRKEEALRLKERQLQEKAEQRFREYRQREQHEKREEELKSSFVEQVSQFPLRNGGSLFHKLVNHGDTFEQTMALSNKTRTELAQYLNNLQSFREQDYYEREREMELARKKEQQKRKKELERFKQLMIKRKPLRDLVQQTGWNMKSPLNIKPFPLFDGEEITLAAQRTRDNNQMSGELTNDGGSDGYIDNFDMEIEYDGLDENAKEELRFIHHSQFVDKYPLDTVNIKGRGFDLNILDFKKVTRLLSANYDNIEQLSIDLYGQKQLTSKIFGEMFEPRKDQSRKFAGIEHFEINIGNCPDIKSGFKGMLKEMTADANVLRTLSIVIPENDWVDVYLVLQIIDMMVRIMEKFKRLRDFILDISRCKNLGSSVLNLIGERLKSYGIEGKHHGDKDSFGLRQFGLRFENDEPLQSSIKPHDFNNFLAGLRSISKPMKDLKLNFINRPLSDESKSALDEFVSKHCLPRCKLVYFS